MIGPVAGSGLVDRAHLEAFPTLSGLPGTELDVLAEALKEVSVGAGAEIVTLDDYGAAVYFVEQGEAEVRTESGEDTQTVGPGDSFGEIGLLLTGQRTATVVSRTPMRLLSLSDHDFERIRARVPELEQALRQIGLDRARQ